MYNSIFHRVIHGYMPKSSDDLILYLAVSAIFCGGIMTGFGYAFLDEFLLYSLITGFLVQCKLSHLYDPFSRLKNLYCTEFKWLDIAPIFLFLYLFLSSLISVYIFKDWKLLRWAMLYGGMLIAVCLVININTSIKNSYILLRTCCIYFSAWILHWIILEVLLGIRWETMQAITWSGSTYAAFPAVITLPLALLAIKDIDSRVRRYGWIALILCGICAQLYSSRILTITVLIAIPIAMLWLSWRKVIIICLVIISAQFTGAWTSNFVHQLPVSPTVLEAGQIATKMALKTLIMTPGMGIESVSFINNPRESDLDRHAHLVCAKDFLLSTFSYRWFFGYGQDKHKQVLLTCSAIQPFITKDQTVVRSTAVVAIVINHGFLGAALIMLCILNNLRYLFSNSTWRVMIPFYLLALSWGLITDYRDHLLIWIIISFNILSIEYVRHQKITNRYAADQSYKESSVG